MTKWLSDISEKLASSHGDIGTSKQTVEKLLNDHDKQAENAKVYLYKSRVSYDLTMFSYAHDIFLHS